MLVILSLAILSILGMTAVSASEMDSGSLNIDDSQIIKDTTINQNANMLSEISDEISQMESEDKLRFEGIDQNILKEDYIKTDNAESNSQTNAETNTDANDNPEINLGDESENDESDSDNDLQSNDSDKYESDDVSESYPLNTKIIINTSSIRYGEKFSAYLKDIDNNPIANQKLSLTVNGKTYTATTNSKGLASFKLDLAIGKHQIELNYKGCEKYNPSQLIKNISIAKAASIIKIANASVVKERNLIIFLLNSQGKAIANQKVSVEIAKKAYNATTDKNGRISLKQSLNPGKYAVKVTFSGNENYTHSNKAFTMRIYKLKTHFKIPAVKVIKGTKFYAYVIDEQGNAVKSKAVKITYRNKKYSKKTNRNGRFTLKINAKPGKYKMSLTFNEKSSYLKTSKKLTIKSYNAKTRILLQSKTVVRGKYLKVLLKYNTKHNLANKKITIKVSKIKYKRTTNDKGIASLRLTFNAGTHKVKVNFAGSNGFKKSSLSTKIKITPNTTAKINAKSKTMHLNSKSKVRYSIKLTDLFGNALKGESLKVKVKCNNFTSGSGVKISKKTIVLSSDSIYNKKKDKALLNQMAKILRSKGYKVIVSGIGPNYHVNAVKKYKNVCVFSLVGGIDSGMYVDMASNYYQSYLKKNKNQFVLGCLNPPNYVNLANRTWLVRAHDDNYSPKSFKGLYFPGTYLNKKTHVNYVYGGNADELVSNFLKYAKKGKSHGLNNTVPGSYRTYKLTTSSNGYVYLNLPIGYHTIICSLTNPTAKLTAHSTKVYVKVIK